MEKKTILYVSPHVNQDGAERSLMAIVRYSISCGYMPILIIPRVGRIVNWLDKDGIRYIVCPYKNMINYKGHPRPLYALAKQCINEVAVSRVVKQLSIKEILCVHTNSIVTDFGVQLAKRLSVPHVQHIREFGKLDFDMSWEYPKRIFSQRFSYSTLFVCISDAIKKYYSQYFDSNKLKRIYNGVLVPVDCEEHRSSGKLRLVMVGRISQEKGYDTVIKALAKIKNREGISLDIWGEGVDKEKLEKLVVDLGLSGTIKFCGYSHNIPYQQYDAGIIASRNEAFGRVTAEYMGHALAVIASNSGANPELVEDGVTGFLFKSGDPSSLSQAIIRLLGESQGIAKMGKIGHKRALAMFSEDRYVKDIINIYKQIESK